MSEKSNQAQDDYDRSVQAVRRFKNIYNQVIHRIPNAGLKSSVFDKHSISAVEAESELTPERKLKLDIGVKLQSILGKQGKKHDDKTKILTVALEVLEGQKSCDDLEAAKSEFPAYRKALFGSETEQLIEAVLDLKKSAAHNRLE